MQRAIQVSGAACVGHAGSHAGCGGRELDERAGIHPAAAAEQMEEEGAMALHEPLADQQGQAARAASNCNRGVREGADGGSGLACLVGSDHHLAHVAGLNHLPARGTQHAWAHARATRCAAASTRKPMQAAKHNAPERRGHVAQAVVDVAKGGQDSAR